MKYHILTYGCQMNVYDSDVMGDLLADAGHEPAMSEHETDLLLINTCAIRDSAESRIHGQVSRLQQLKQTGRLRYIGVCGCMAQNHQQALLERHPYIDLVLGTGEIKHLPELVDRLARGGGPVVACELDYSKQTQTDWPRAFTEPPRNKSLPVFVSVQKGCNYNCTFCIVPTTRGPERYRPVDDVLAEVARLTQWGYGEITLIGQTVNAYEWQGVDFSSLLSRVALSTPARIRFATSHPRHFTDRLIETIATHDNIAEYIHLPLQSGSDRILKRMARRYTAREYLDIVKRIRTILADAPEGVAVASDVIVGFPGETDEDFAATLRAQDEANWQGLYSFKYSPRPHTPAIRFDDAPVPEPVAAERLRIVQERHHAQMDAVFAAFVGREVEVIVEQQDARGCRGRCRSNHVVIIDNPAACEIGETVAVRIERARPYTMHGTIINRGATQSEGRNHVAATGKGVGGG